MPRSLLVAAFALSLAAGCRSTGVRPVTAPPVLPPPMIGSAGWQPDYLARRPIASPYGMIATPAAPVRLVRAVPKPPRLQPVPGAYAPDYRWVIGRLEQDDLERWYVRYSDAPPGKGSKVELMGAHALRGLVAGELVRVEGERLRPAAHEDHPVYRVTTIQAVTPVSAKVGKGRQVR